MDAMDSFGTEIKLVLPMLITAGGAFLILLLRAITNKALPYSLVALATLLAAMATLFHNQAFYEASSLIWSGSISIDPLMFWVQFGLLAASAINVFLMSGSLKSAGVESIAEFYSLVLMCLFGALLFVSAGSLLTLFLGLETMSIAAYPLCGAALGSRRSAESALKYFILGSFSSGFLLFGMALIYGASGSLTLIDIANSSSYELLALGIGLSLVGFLFKVGAVPLHFWLPDVYQGAPTVVTSFMGSVIKISSLVAFLKFAIYAGCFDLYGSVWPDILWLVSLLTVVLGNLAAVRQDNVKRMLAYSSIANIGFMLMGLLGGNAENGPSFITMIVDSQEAYSVNGASAILFYLLVYSLVSIGAFAILTVVGGDEVSDKQAFNLSKFKGLGKNRPVLALVLSFFLLGLAGLPPGIAGLVAKFNMFVVAIKLEYIGLPIVAALMSAVAAYYYLRVIVYMYFYSSEEERAKVECEAACAPWSTRLVIGTCFALLLVLGLFPNATLERASIVVKAFMEQQLLARTPYAALNLIEDVDGTGADS